MSKLILQLDNTDLSYDTTNATLHPTTNRTVLFSVEKDGEVVEYKLIASTKEIANTVREDIANKQDVILNPTEFCSLRTKVKDG